MNGRNQSYRLFVRGLPTLKNWKTMARSDDDKAPLKITDIEALRNNIIMAVQAFNEQWVSIPSFTEDCIVMDIRQLRNAMGLRSTMEMGDTWPIAEQILLNYGFRWHWLGGSRVMFLRERDGFVQDTGWQEVEEIEDED